MESALTLAAHSSKFLPVLHRPCLSIKNVNMHLAHVFQLFNFILGEREVEVILNFSRDSCVIFSSLLSHLSLALERRASVSLNKHLRTGSNKTVFYECELFYDSACLLGDPQGIQRPSAISLEWWWCLDHYQSLLTVLMVCSVYWE